jgi:hypothetical protein
MVTVIGGTVVATGIALMPLPGPGTLIVAGGLSILAREYPAAGRALERVKQFGRRRPEATPPGPDHREPS